MKIAISGKGGVGKTTLAGLLGRLWGRSGKRVLLVDADPSPNLISMLGVDEEKRREIIPLNRMDDLIAERTGARPGNSYGALFRLNPEVEDLIDSLSIPGADGVRLLVLGALQAGGGGCYCPENVMLKTMFRKLSFRDEIVIMDLEAGVEHLGRATARNMDLLLIVVEPGQRSLNVAEQIRTMARDIDLHQVLIVVNKAKEADLPILKAELEQRQLPLLGALPYNPDFVAADLKGISPLDYCPSSTFEPVRQMMEQIVDLIAVPA
jgi:CO dehydrogenase maturation factor